MFPQYTYWSYGLSTQKSSLPKFHSIRQLSVVDQIIETFKQMLLQGDLYPGQRLPSEAELTQQLGVGRSALREAMKILQALGVVRIQQGDGTYIVDEPSSTLLNPLTFAILLEADMNIELVELRLLVEVGYCELAAQKATAADWERIEAAACLLEDYAAQPDVEEEMLAHLDLDFHRAIMEASHNPLVVRIATTVMELFFASVRDTYLSRADNRGAAVQFHRHIMEALRDGSPEAIRTAVEDSLVYWREEVQKRKPRETNPLTD